MMMGNKRRAVASGGAHFLPEEMMTEVFLRLPIKSILRFRAVCRSWNAVLSSDEFCRLHMGKAEVEAAPPNLFFTSPTAGSDATAVYSSSSSGLDDSLLFTLDGVRGGDFISTTPAPCRGLTLLHDPFAPAYYVFNASTRAVTRLPPCHNALYVTAGLGFDAQTKKYKVVRLFLGDYRCEQYMMCEIYTLGGDHGDDWKPPAAGVPFRFCRAVEATISHARNDKMLPVFANGFLHWLIGPYFVVKRPRAAILSFSVTDEIFAWVQSTPFEVSRRGRGSAHDCFPPPLPVSDMPPAYLAGVLYWMSDPRLGESDERAIVSFDITTRQFAVIPCPPCVATWNCDSASDAFVVELEGTLCAVLANLDAEELSIWKRDNGQWHSAYTVYLEGWPGYSLGANVVVPWAIDPKDGKILLNTGRKLGFFDPARRFIDNLYDLEEVLHVRSTEQSSHVRVSGNLHILRNTNMMLRNPLHRNHFLCSTRFQPILRLLYLGIVLLAPVECNAWREEIHYILK